MNSKVIKEGIMIIPSNKQKDVEPVSSRQFNMEARYKMKFKTRLALVALIVFIMFLLHNSFWLWGLDDRVPLLFGFMPFAFSYYVGYALLALLAIMFITRIAWPDPPEDVIEPIVDREGPGR